MVPVVPRRRSGLGAHPSSRSGRCTLLPDPLLGNRIQHAGREFEDPDLQVDHCTFRSDAWQSIHLCRAYIGCGFLRFLIDFRPGRVRSRPSHMTWMRAKSNHAGHSAIPCRSRRRSPMMVLLCEALQVGPDHRSFGGFCLAVQPVAGGDDVGRPGRCELWSVSGLGYPPAHRQTQPIRGGTPVGCG